MLYSDARAIKIKDVDFASGSLIRTSYARPGKLFSANTSIIAEDVGMLKQTKFTSVVNAVIEIIRPK